MTVMDVFINGITDMLPDIIVVGALLLGKLAVGIVEAIPDLVGKIPQIVTEIVDGFGAKAEEFKSIGTNIVKGLWEGIKAMGSWLKDKLFGWLDDVIDDTKEHEEIHSPSRKWARVIGKPDGQGVGVGFVEGLEESEKLIQDEMNGMTAKISANVDSDFTSTAGKTETEQTNELLKALFNLFESGKAKTNISNARDLRSVSYG
jgi:phage-related protein